MTGKGTSKRLEVVRIKWGPHQEKLISTFRMGEEKVKSNWLKLSLLSEHHGGTGICCEMCKWLIHLHKELFIFIVCLAFIFLYWNPLGLSIQISLSQVKSNLFV